MDLVEVGKMCTAFLQATSFDKQPINFIACELVSDITGTRVQGLRIERRGQSQYDIIYQPIIKGRHQLHIEVEGQHIRRNVTVTLPVEKLETPFLNIVGMEGPEGVAVNQKGELVVAERNGHQVSVLSPSREREVTRQQLGSYKGPFRYPHGVAVDSEGCILVADKGNHRI